MWSLSGNKVVLLVNKQILIMTPKGMPSEELSDYNKPVDHIDLSQAEELKWMKLSKSAYSFSEFTRGFEIDEKTLIHEIGVYLIFGYEGEDYDEFAEREEGL